MPARRSSPDRDTRSPSHRLIVRTCLALLGLCSACPRSAAPDTFMTIELGRAGVMLDQLHEMIDVPPAPELPARPTLADIESQLIIERSRLCAEGRFMSLTCPPWTPGAAADEVLGAVSQLWDTVCDERRAHSMSDEERVSVCPME